MQTEIITINNSNIPLVSDLLYTRNRTIKQYTDWKYGCEDDGQFRGLIAKSGSEVVGCFGIIPKQLEYPDGSIIDSGWFADWFVSPEARGKKVGEIMLNELTNHLPIIFGHPGPEKAQKLCRSNGYEQIGFQARRRFVLRRWSYNWKRKNIFRSIKSRFTLPKAKESPQITHSGSQRKMSESIKATTPLIQFKISESFEERILSQPIASVNTRQYGEWLKQDISIKYFDERLRNGEKRRSVLMVSGERILEEKMWHIFINDSRVAGHDYIEIFTTNTKLDSLLNQLGAWSIYEPPILVKGLAGESNIQLQAWDRENWTFLASEEI